MLDRVRAVFSAQASAGRLSAIDGLRAIAALTVMVHHFHNAIAAGRAGTWFEPLETLAEYGWSGVQIFFVLSGFVISHSVRGHRLTWGFFGRFALRRSMRLDPPYWTVVMICLGLMMVLGSDRADRVDVGVVLANLLYLDNVLELPSLVAVGWTLCLELQFYLAFVALLGVAQFVTRTGLSERAARGVIFGPLAVLSVAIFAHVVPIPWRGLFINYWSLFFVGVLVRWSLDGAVPSGWLFAMVGLELGSLWVHWDAGPLVGAGTAMLIWSLGKRDKLGSVLSGRVMQFVGQISYSLYLVHPLVGNRMLRRVVRMLPAPPEGLLAIGLFVGATVVSIAASTAFYLAIEYPSLSLSRRIKLRRATPPAAVLAASSNESAARP